MKRAASLASLVALLFASEAQAGSPTPLSMQIDRTQDPSPICVYLKSTDTVCVPIGTLSSGHVWTSYGAALPPLLPVPNGGTGGTSAFSALVNLGVRGRKAVTDANYTMLPSDVYVGMTTMTAPRIWILPPASSYPVSAPLITADESGNCSLSSAITFQAFSVASSATAAVTGFNVIPVASTTGIVAGQAVSGAGISGALSVVSINGLNVTVSANITIASGTTLIFSDVLVTGGKNDDGSAITSTAIAAPGQKLAWHSNGSSGWTYQ